ncbi:MAG: response regulator [Bacteroidota bacterium]
MADTITVIMADDHPIFRKGLRQILDEAPGMEVLGETGDGESALSLIERLKPAVAVLDIDMPKKDGLMVAEAVRKNNLPVEIVFLTMYNEESVLNRALDLGVRGYLLKEDAATDLVRCIETVSSGKYFLSPLISDMLIHRNDRLKSLTKENPALDQLTPSERRILSLIAENKTTGEIAETLHISGATVEKHRANIAKKLNLRGSYSLLRFAIQNRSLL